MRVPIEMNEDDGAYRINDGARRMGKHRSSSAIGVASDSSSPTNSQTSLGRIISQQCPITGDPAGCVQLTK